MFSKLKLPSKPEKPSRETKHQLREGRVNIEVVFAADVVSSELAKVYLVEAVQSNVTIEQAPGIKQAHTTSSGLFIL